MSRLWINIGIGIAALALLIIVIPQLSSGEKKPLRELPYYRPVQQSAINNDAGGRHTIRAFSFTDQTGKTVTNADFKGKITLVNFFFATCEGVCPVMNRQMERVYNTYKNNSNVLFLSHTVNPENDSVPVLAAYGARFKADPVKWKFVTGNKAEIYQMARTSYLLSDSDGNGSQEDFMHSDQIGLIDGEGHIRGRYTGTDAADVDRLMIDLELLLNK
ncbi:MAG: SCO family protein [Bacteroidia bacterium]|jgi:protein SCO1/2|nr:SCO family protein [Bacteroidia bacterium]